MAEFIVTIAKKDLQQLGAVRCMNGLKAAMDDEQIWLRGLDNITVSQPAIKQLPLKHQYSVDENNLLFPAGGITPTGILKEMQWMPLMQFMPIELPVSAQPGTLNSPLDIQLIASAVTRKGAALLTSLHHWKQYAESASGVRLQRLKFAVSEKNEVLITGEPLPPLPGKEYWQSGRMLLPSGYDFAFPLISSILHQQITTEESIILFEQDGTRQSIDQNFLIPATRSAIRMTGINQQYEE